MLHPRASLLLLLASLAATHLPGAPLRVGIDLDGEPMTYIDSKGVPQGFAVEIVTEIAREMKVEVAFVAKPWAQMMEDFRAGRSDALANITFTDERARFIDFMDPHIVMNGAIFVRKGDTRIRRPGDLRNRQVAVKPGGAPHQYLQIHDWAQHVVPTATLRDSLRAVADGRADAALDARIIGLKNIRDERLTNVELADVALLDFAQRLHIGFQPGDPARIALFNEGLARLRANGTYDRIHDRWIGPLEPRRVWLRELRPYFIGTALVLALTVGVLFWQRRLLAQLDRQARALGQSEERLTLVLEGSEDGFWDWDMRTNRVERSERWASMLGFTLAEVPPSIDGSTQLVHPDDLEIYAAYRARLNLGEHVRYDIEYRMRTKSGDWRWILDRGKVVARAPDGTPLRMAGTHTDITDLKRARDEAARQEARFRFIYEHAPVGISWLERQRAETRLVNPAHERITGVPATASRDTRNYIAATHPDDRETQRAYQEQLYGGGIDHFAMEKRYVHPDGKVVWALLTMHLFHDPVSGQKQEVTTLVDIDGLKRGEAERERLGLKMLEAQKLESLGVLAGGIAHDFNNLLTVVLANASFVRSEGGTDDRIVQIEVAARRAADLCRQMLSYAGKGNFVVERVDLAGLVEDIAHLLHVSISKKARLELALDAGLPPVAADASQLRQVVMNLVINASEALGDAPGEIRLTMRLDRPEPPAHGATHSFDLPPGNCICLEIADTGHGMDAATIARIFDPFFTTKFTGRGLGLAAVLGIVRAHHGALTVESAPGKGSTFRLYLPATRTPAAPATVALKRPARPDPARGTILIADDEPSVLAAADAVLRHHGYLTVLATNGQEALEKFRANVTGFAAVLLDLTMPGLDGAETLRAIRAEHPSARVVVMSGYSEADVTERLRGLGPIVFVRKPFTRDMLLDRLNEITAGYSDSLSKCD